MATFNLSHWILLQIKTCLCLEYFWPPSNYISVWRLKSFPFPSLPLDISNSQHTVPLNEIKKMCGAML